MYIVITTELAERLKEYIASTWALEYGQDIQEDIKTPLENPAPLEHLFYDTYKELIDDTRIADVWTLQDVRETYIGVTVEEAKEVLNRIGGDIDANTGITRDLVHETIVAVKRGE